MKLSPEPVEIEYLRWRHKKLGYKVTILSLSNYRGKDGYYTDLLVEGTSRDPKKTSHWSAQRFIKDFKPIGRKVQKTSVWETLTSDPFART